MTSNTKLANANERRQKNKIKNVEKIIFCLEQSSYISAYELAKNLNLTSATVAEYLEELFYEGTVLMLQIILENRLNKLFYIPKHDTNTKIKLPSELVNEFKWHYGKELYFIAYSASEFIIREKPNLRDKFSAGMYKARLEGKNNFYFIRLPYNWIIFYELVDIDLNAFIANMEEKYLLYAIPKDSKKIIVPVEPAST